MKTPILFIIFNRPEQTKRVFAEIKKAKPEKLFIAGDGPRTERPEDVEKCKHAREIVNEIDWPCEIKTLFQEKNLGCKFGATTGITWFFNNVEEGIILEDDCLPDQSFFPFCEQMLEHYRNEEKLSIISGHNIVGSINTECSYIFSRYGHLWGWATWRRVWNQYDISMKLWLDKKNRKKIEKAIDDKERWNFKQIVYEETFLDKKDTWDYQWESFRLLKGILSIIPKENMIENLGFGPDATHTKTLKSPLILPRRETSFPLKYNNGLLIPYDNYDKKLGPKTSNVRFYRYKIKKMILKITPSFLRNKKIFANIKKIWQHT